MDAASDPTVHTIVMMTSSQVGKTSIIENIIGYLVDQDPCPILVIQPTLEIASTFSTDRLAPMLRDTPCLSDRVSESKARDTRNTILHKQFPGGHITIAAANSPASLASRPIRVVLLDEVDRYPLSAGGEGDPTSLAIKRTTTFWNRLIVMASSPTVEDLSQIEARYNESDRRRYYVPCPHCGHEQVLKWAQVKWPKDKPEDAEYQCEAAGCGTLWSDADRWGIVRKGRWIGEAPFKGIAGFHLSELYSPWVRLGDMAAGFVSAAPHPDRLQAWINTSLGETWKENYSAKAGASELKQRAGGYSMLSVPDGGLMLTAGVDVQDNRLEFVVRAWGREERSWLVNWGQIFGDPSQMDVWRELDDVLAMEYRREAGGDMSVRATAIDSGGHYTHEVYEYCRTREKNHVIAIKGMSDPRKPIIGKPSRVDIVFKNAKIAKGVCLYPVGPNALKTTIYGRLRQASGDSKEELKAGVYHWPSGLADEYFEQLTSEKKVYRAVKGRTTVVWEKKSGARNEALDCEAYALAALHYFYSRTNRNTIWDKLEAMLAQAVEPEAETEADGETTDNTQETKTPARRWKRRRGSFSRGTGRNG